MSSPLINAFRSILTAFDERALEPPLAPELIQALRANKLVHQALFDGNRIHWDLWKALIWASKTTPSVQLMWPETGSNLEKKPFELQPIRRVSHPRLTGPLRIKRDTQNRIDENMIIHGENLSVMRGLRKDFSNRIKLCYIDPPYGTGSGDFRYRDQFEDAEWLTFMSERLDALKPLLTVDGVVIVQCSFHHHARLESLLKSKFTNHLCTLHLQVRHPDRHLTADKQFNDVMEQVLIFSNNAQSVMPKRRVRRDDSEYIYHIEPIQISRLMTINGREVGVYEPGSYRIEKRKPTVSGLKKISIRGSIREKNNSGRIYVRNIEPMAHEFPPMTLFKYPGIGADGLGYRYFYTPDSVGKEGRRRKNGGYFQGFPVGEPFVEKPYANFMNLQSDYNRVRHEGGVDLRNGKKPEKLMSFLISGFTSPSDWVLDYHLGSGTTCAVAHKLGRRYVGIEKMDYVETLAVERLTHVIGAPPYLDTDQTGISQTIGWQGGGSFLYCRAVDTL